RLPPRAQPQLPPARRLLGERQRRDRLHGAAPLGQHVDEARDQLAGLAGPGGRLDDQRLVERGADALTLGVVNERCHSRPWIHLWSLGEVSTPVILLV